MSGLQPISTAPRDGTVVDLYAVNDGLPTQRLPGMVWDSCGLTMHGIQGVWVDSSDPADGVMWSESDGRDGCGPTHWSPRVSSSENEVGHLRERLATAMVGDLVHSSSCSTSGAPANDPGECDCGGSTWRSLAESLHSQFDHQGCTCTFQSDNCCAFAEVERAMRLQEVRTSLARTVSS